MSQAMLGPVCEAVNPADADGRLSQDLLRQAMGILERADAGRGVRLRTLCEVHRLLLHATDPQRAGVLRRSWAVIRLGGRVHHRPPGSPRARRQAVILVRWLRDQLANRDSSAAVSLAAELMFRLCDIHPFPDGNGRLAATVATWILARSGHEPVPARTLDQYLRSRRRESYLRLNRRPVDPSGWSSYFQEAVAATFRFQMKGFPNVIDPTFRRSEEADFGILP